MREHDNVSCNKVALLCHVRALGCVQIWKLLGASGNACSPWHNLIGKHRRVHTKIHNSVFNHARVQREHCIDMCKSVIHPIHIGYICVWPTWVRCVACKWFRPNKKLRPIKLYSYDFICFFSFFVSLANASAMTYAHLPICPLPICPLLFLFGIIWISECRSVGRPVDEWVSVKASTL